MAVGEIAWVGWEGSSHDWSLVSKVPGLILADFVDDIVNLRGGRDFLEEEKTYCIVVLCYIYSAVTSVSDLRKTRLPANGKWCVSNLSTRENWRRRLLATGARTILAQGDDSEVAYSYVGDLPGYVAMVDENFSRWDLC